LLLHSASRTDQWHGSNGPHGSRSRHRGQTDGLAYGGHRSRPFVGRDQQEHAGTYTFVIERIDQETSRLIVRDRARWKLSEWPFAALVYEPLHAYMETGLIRGVRRRAEAAVSLHVSSGSAEMDNAHSLPV
jgi:hypothetical protein